MPKVTGDWYVVDGTGKTRGPLPEQKVLGLYNAKHIHKNTYAWNGTTVKEWKPISSIKPLYNKCEKQASTVTDPNKAKVVMKAVRKGYFLFVIRWESLSKIIDRIKANIYNQTSSRK